jgi:hypothetical protein
MAKGRKSKGRGGRASASATAEPSQKKPPAPQAEPGQTPLVPHPPRRNVPLLVLSIVLLVAWMTVLVWLAATA